MDSGIILRFLSRKVEKWVIGLLTFFILSVLGIYLYGLGGHTFFSMYICPVIVSFVVAVCMSVMLD